MTGVALGAYKPRPTKSVERNAHFGSEIDAKSCHFSQGWEAHFGGASSLKTTERGLPLCDLSERGLPLCDLTLAIVLPHSPPDVGLFASPPERGPPLLLLASSPPKRGLPVAISLPRIHSEKPRVVSGLSLRTASTVMRVPSILRSRGDQYGVCKTIGFWPRRSMLGGCIPSASAPTMSAIAMAVLPPHARVWAAANQWQQGSTRGPYSPGR